MKGVMSNRMAKDRRSLPISFREHACARWARRHLGRIDHERRVMNIATTFFDLLDDLHGLDESHRRLLRVGAIVHDVGRSIDDRRHPSIGAAMILEDESLPLSAQDRRRVAYLARHHRGAVPQVGFDELLQSGDERKAMRRILAILRAADSFDSRNLTPPRLIVARKGRRLRITCFIQGPPPKARKIFGKRKKFRLLEELLGCRVDVCIKRAEAVETV
jgi:exopolyphosphatase/guanosine-5'-triphosphate,3'-diphosphate pyrophosphatase